MCELQFPQLEDVALCSSEKLVRVADADLRAVYFDAH